ncbi:MAG: hypothetical protein QY310_15445 [Candidatus Jettenia sp. CY-1]|nr:hypothetical protein [Candidatus Jettenia sp.]UJS16940.1 MAG: hypothetical protein L3J17_13635 [Candidatus Jettenia sp.]WKZ18800.1 MAG: hypothetical protein QY310_15445 [Candidatus Jettenia sp. CY-1]
METMETEVKKIPIRDTPNLSEKIKEECDFMNSTSYSLVATFVLDDLLYLIFQRQIQNV